MYPKLGLTRNIVRRNYALLTPDGYVPSVLPGWSGCTPFVIFSAALGAKLTQLVIELEAGGTGSADTGTEEYFFYLVAGQGTCNGQELNAGGYAYVPPHSHYQFTSTQPKTRLLIFSKTFQPGPVEVPKFFLSREQDAPEAPFLGDPRARLKTLLPDAPAMDMAVNLFTYDPGATLPFGARHPFPGGERRLPAGCGLASRAGGRLPLDRPLLPAMVHRGRSAAGALHLL
jgi:(S)-ureidoglycine aminohydrolase